MAVSRVNLRYLLCGISAGGRSDNVACAPTKSTFDPEIKIETARKAMVKDLGRVFIILASSEQWRITTIRKKAIINEFKINNLLFGTRTDREKM